MVRDALLLLDTAIDGVELDLTGPELSFAIKSLDRLTAKVTAAVSAFDADGHWGADHATSMNSWLVAHAEATRKSANTFCREGRRLLQLPVTANAWVTGQLSHGQVQAILANIRKEHVDLFAKHEADLIPAFLPLTVRQTSIAMNHWAARAAAEIDGPGPAEPEPHLRISTTLNGRWQLTGTLNTEAGAVMERALRIARPDDTSLATGAANAHALDTIMQFYLDNQTAALGGRHRPHVNVVIDLNELEGRGQGRLLEGTPLNRASMKPVLCDCNIHRVITNGRSSILDYGHSTRTIPAPLYTALVLRDQHCRFPGCEREPHHCEGHHVHPWENGGPTCLANLALLCKYHHHRCAHGHGWRMTIDHDATLHITDPNDKHMTTKPPGAQPPALTRPAGQLALARE